MGQQQLLLLVLGIVLVGIAVVVGIQAFTEQKRKESMDQTVQTAVEMAGRVMAWKLTPKALGGGADEALLGNSVDLARLGYITNGTAICDYAAGSPATTKGDNCVITPYGEFHLARATGTTEGADGIGYIHAITRYGKHTYRVRIISKGGTGLRTALDEIAPRRAALPMP